MNTRVLKSSLIVLLTCTLLVLIISIYKTYTYLSKPMLLSGQPIIIEVKPNSTANALIEVLYSKHLIDSKRFFLNLMHFEGLAERIQAGIYQLKLGESAQTFIARVVAGDVLKLPFRIIEGTTLEQVKQTLQNSAFLVSSASDSEDLKEGLLLADTYYYLAGSRAELLLKTAHKNLMRELESNWQSRSPNLPYKTAYELLTAASILEKETAVPRERKIIAGIIVNRLRKHMPLQMDPTVVYALGKNYPGKLSHQHLQIDSPYNTYRNQGLPPTPIAMVGKLSIDAAAHPEFTDYLYFVAKGDGQHQFSKTYLEQKKAISHYLGKE